MIIKKINKGPYLIGKIKELENSKTEMAVIGCVINDISMLDDASIYIPTQDVWSDNRCRVLWNKVVGMAKVNELVDITTLCASISNEEKKKGILDSFIVEVVTTSPSPSNVSYYSRIVYEKYLLRKVNSIAGEIQESINNNVDVYGLLESAHTDIGNAIRVKPGKDFSIDELLDTTVENLKDKDNTINTGYSDIDELTGGMTRGEITIVGGRPSHGKTTLAINMISNIMGMDNGYKACFINREMTNVEMMNKLIVMESGNLSYKMLRKRIYTEKDFEEIERTKTIIKQKYSSDRFVMFDDIRDYTASASEIRKFNPDIVVDDYVQLINPMSHTKDRRLQIEEIVNSYKWLAKELNCVVVLVSQLNRSIETRLNPRPRMSDLAESGSLEQAAENILFVYYDYKVHYDSSEKGPNEIEVIASKVRYGESGTVDLGYEGDKCQFYEKSLDYL